MLHVSFFIAILFLNLTEAIEEVEVASELANIIDGYVRSKKHHEVSEEEYKLNDITDTFLGFGDMGNAPADGAQEQIFDTDSVMGNLVNDKTWKKEEKKGEEMEGEAEAEKKEETKAMDEGTSSVEILVVETDGQDVFDKKFWKNKCKEIPENAEYIKVKMGIVIDYFKPVEGSTFCEMLLSKSKHQWSPDGKKFQIPIYGDTHLLINELGGSAKNWPRDNDIEEDSRWRLAVWGNAQGIHKGGCCDNDYEGNGYPGQWAQAFQMFYIISDEEVSVGDVGVPRKVLYDTEVAFHSREEQYLNLPSTQYLKEMNKPTTPAESRTKHTLSETKALIAGYKAAGGANGQMQTSEADVGNEYDLVFDHPVNQQSVYNLYKNYASTKNYDSEVERMDSSPAEPKQEFVKSEYNAHAAAWTARGAYLGNHNHVDVSVGTDEMELNIADPLYNIESYNYAENVLLLLMAISGSVIVGFIIGKLKNKSLMSSPANYQTLTEMV